MNCPRCRAKMESEDSPMLIGLRPTGSPTEGPWRGVFRPGAHYQCLECDSEWVWIKGESENIRMLDAADNPFGMIGRV